MRNRILQLTATTLLLSAAHLGAEEPVDHEVINHIRYEGFHNSQVMEIARALTEEMGPRLTGSPQLKRANEWTRDKLASWGLDGAHLESFEFGRGWSFTNAILFGSKTLSLFNCSNTCIVIGDAISVAMERSTCANIISPGFTLEFPDLFANIFSVRVIPIYIILPIAFWYIIYITTNKVNMVDRPMKDYS